MPILPSPRICWAALALLLLSTSAHADDAPPAHADEHPHEPEKPDTPGDAANEKPILTLDIVRASLEPAYLAYTHGFTGVDPLIFESNIVAHFMVTRPNWPFAIVLSPKIVVRMFREESAPVKSPSYMPRITAYVWFQRTVNKRPTFYGSLMLSHHSNGQALSFFDDSGNIRHDGGSFSTNYLEASLYATGFSGRWFGWSVVSFEWHRGLGENAELRDRYGLTRLHLASTVLANLPLKGELNLRISAIIDKFQHSESGGFLRAFERFPVSVRYSISIPGIDLGLYVAYYVGHDYYNIYFDRFAHMVQVGISGAVTPSLSDQN